MIGAPSAIDLVGGPGTWYVPVASPVRVVEVAVTNLDIERVGVWMGL